MVVAAVCCTQELDPEVVAHLHGMGLPIAALALPWICSAFTGHLRIEEVLLLWDRVLGLDSLLPLPLLAVAIVCFRCAFWVTVGSLRCRRTLGGLHTRARGGILHGRRDERLPR